MEPIVTVFAQSPDRGRGLARDMQVRWALEEVGLRYGVRCVTFAEMRGRVHLARNPFGQIPAYEQEGLVLFESGAIVLHIAERHAGLLPGDADARSRAKMWMFAALSTIEPVIVERSMLILTEEDEEWFAPRLALVDARIRKRLADLATHLGSSDWLEKDFSAGDLMMVGVLRRLGESDLLADEPRIAAYVARGEARPAFQRAFAAQLELFKSSSGE
ncbi:glutathione S-transferase [Novosphingobium sp. PC22D]|uniref:glutathione S-transferase family protein n=1 Tax=Novosphingobium sp. PC22D TaxID=1962403 RepID=UPI000BF20205|nr:glutathione S-transferase family protein [Novosphingobium sp. PC22D]PEQ14694.1 glutathione S-transferase [Novosphingobium sp. PC22D]